MSVFGHCKSTCFLCKINIDINMCTINIHRTFIDKTKRHTRAYIVLGLCHHLVGIHVVNVKFVSLDKFSLHLPGEINRHINSRPSSFIGKSLDSSNSITVELDNDRQSIK